MTLIQAIQNRITELCKAKNMSINMLATRAGLNEATIRGILNSNRNPTMHTIYYICVGFGVSLGDFYNSPLFNIENIED